MVDFVLANISDSKMKKFVFFLVFIFPLFCFSVRASAADFSVDSLGVSVRIKGDLVSGDAERLASVYLGVKPIAGFYFYPRAIYLDSAGGDVLEAIKMADLIKSLGVSVATPLDAEGVCASSCFLLYVAAIERAASGIDTLRLHGGKGYLGPVGIHRPYIQDPSGGPAAAQRQEQVMAEMRAYLSKANVGGLLIDKMMSHASNDIYWLTEEDLRAFGTFSPGVEEQVISRCGYSARKEASMSAREYIKSSESGMISCVRNYVSQTYVPLLETAVNRMRKGWRPWR